MRTSKGGSRAESWPGTNPAAVRTVRPPLKDAISSAGRTADENQSCAERRSETSCVCFCANVSGPQNRYALEENKLQISCAAIYRAVKRGLLDEKAGGYIRKKDWCSYHLRRKGEPRKPNNTENKQGKFHIERTIGDRPEAANNRTELGHWEGDTVAGTMGGALLVTQVDRKTGHLLCQKVSDGCAETVKEAMIRMFSRLPEDKVRSITLDRGHEFAKYAEVSSQVHNVPIYFADPHSPWQRGTNENTNGLLRQYFPKYTSLDDVSEEEIEAAVNAFNLRPRKRLGWLSPFEVFFLTSLHLT